MTTDGAPFRGGTTRFHTPRLRVRTITSANAPTFAAHRAEAKVEVVR